MFKIFRKTDKLGRIAIPQDIREHLRIDFSNAQVEFFYDGEHMGIRKYSEGCVFCNSDKKAKVVHGKPICENCLKEV